MTYGFTDSEFKILNTLVIKPLKLSGARVFVFGSRSRGRHHPFSDIDLLIELPANGEKLEALISKIQEDIEESSFPVKVDLVLSHELASSYRESVLKERLEI